MGDSSRSGRRLLPSLAVVTAAVFAAYSAVISVLVPVQVAAIDPQNKVTSLALVLSASFGFAIVAQPIIGALSDGTRSRLGRRVPWMIGCALVAAATLAAMGGAVSIAALSILWVVAQFALNGVDITSSSYLVDRFPASRRGVAAAVFGVGAIAGGAVGSVLAGVLPSAPAHLVLAALLLAGVGVFIALNRDANPPAAPPEPWRAVARRLVGELRANPVFAWMLASRIFFVLGYYLVYGYMLYIATDYVGVPPRDAPGLVAGLTIAGFVAILVATVVGGWWSDRVGRRRIFLFAACGLLVVAMVIPLVAPTVPGLAAFAVVQGLGFGLYLTCGIAFVSQVLPGGDRNAARDLGIYNVATNVPQALAAPLAALVIGGAGGYGGLFIVAIAAIGISAILVRGIRGVR